MRKHPINQSRPRPPTSFRGWTAFGFLLIFGGCQTSLHAADVPSSDVLRLGFSSSMFIGVNENDAKAAMKIWAQAILTEHGVSVPAEPQVLNGSDAIATAVHNKQVDAVTMTTEEYRTLGGEWMSSRAVLGVSGGLVTEEYLLLVHADSGIVRIDNLRGKSMVLFQNPRASLAPIWLDTVLLRSALPQTRQFLSRVVQATKLTQAVLPVFFRQADACVVTRRGFNTMVELNPQVGRQLKSLVVSPPMVPVAFLFRSDYSDAVKDQIMAEIEKVHSTAASQQILTLFQCENLEVRPVSALASAMDLLASHAELVEAASRAPLPASTGSIPVRDVGSR